MDIAEIEEMAKDYPEFGVIVSASGRPRLPPLSIDFADDYNVAVSCHVRSKSVSTSDLHDEKPTNRKAVRFGEECSPKVRAGLYSHPETLDVIEVPKAGCARFWVKFELGKFLFPKIQGSDLEILNPKVVTLATECFGQEFVQGCYWGA